MSSERIPGILNELDLNRRAAIRPEARSARSSGSTCSARKANKSARKTGIGAYTSEKECATAVRNTAEVMDRLVTMGATQGFPVNGFDNHTAEAASARESEAWLDFVGACRAAYERAGHGASGPGVTPSLLAAASRLQTKTARVLALTMISRVAGHLSTTTPMSTPASVIQPHDRLPEPAPNSRVAAVLEYIHENHSRSSCRLEEVARTLRLSRSYLSRLVQSETGRSFNVHLRLARMNTAARLLQSSSLSIKEISAATGYEHVPSFDRQFRKHFRMTPGEFRRSIHV